MIALPGKDDAEALGYRLHSHAGNLKQAAYMKQHVTLTVFETREAELSCAIGLIVCSTGRFSFPHPRFELFERQIFAMNQDGMR